MRKIFSHLFRAIGLLEQNMSFWQQTSSVKNFFVGILLWSGGMAMAAALTDWMNTFSPFSWVLAGALGIVLYGIIFLLYSLSLHYQTQRDILARMNSVDTGVNPLEKNYSDKRIRLDDIRNPITFQVSGRTITDSEVYASSPVLITSRTQIFNNDLVNCYFVELRENLDVSPRVATSLVDVTITRSKFFEIIFLVPPRYKHMLDKPEMGIYWITK